MQGTTKELAISMLTKEKLLSKDDREPIQKMANGGVLLVPSPQQEQNTTVVGRMRSLGISLFWLR